MSTWAYIRIARLLGGAIALGIYALFYLAGVRDSTALCLGSIVLAIVLTIIIMAIIHNYTSQQPSTPYTQQPYPPPQYGQGPYYPPGQSMYYQQSQPYSYQQPGPYGYQVSKCRYCDSPLSGSPLCPRCGRNN